MHPMLRSTIALASLLAAPLAHADGFGYHSARPVYVPPAPVVQTQVTVVDEPGEVEGWNGWQRRAWFDFEQHAGRRAQQHEAMLAGERADYLAQWGWDPARMAWFDAHQQEERAAFDREEAGRREAFQQQLAWARPGDDEGEGRGWEHRHHHRHHHHDDDED